MKKLPILLCVFLLSACAPSEVPLDKLVERNSIRYEINSQIPFTGVSTVYYENGQLKEKVNWVDGKLNGLFELYHENGQLDYKITYKDGKQNGIAEFYHENGQLKEKLIYKDNELNGLVEAYYENGQLLDKATHKDGKLNGLLETYYENGQEKFSPTCYQNDKEVDISRCK